MSRESQVETQGVRTSEVRELVQCVTGFKPKGDRILIERRTVGEKVVNGIILPGNATEEPNDGFVIAVGPGILNDQGQRVPPDVEVGDHVSWSKYGATEITVQDKPFLLLRDNDIQGVYTYSEVPLDSELDLADDEAPASVDATSGALGEEDTLPIERPCGNDACDCEEPACG